ncbi:Biotin--protein ligase [Microbacterium esteraromaticum]|uniref:biotin--[biotin carboxyl-carrier protein] ligase n=1 Tax=Microbacterium esteraromaticum TaxID=57043 RepID=A0A1R4JEJ1_9MICO|nr:biotin--[acetyl-CoA-carboxylase] ligase [Microbacterium esteraromaticum]SJN30354.1 Biotin--protein ligase [Microbacterium esteraromaticum]
MELTRTASIASHVLVLGECGSTNAELRGRGADAAAWPHLSVLLTDSQTAGRGRLDRQWTTPPGTALAVSVLLRELPAEMEARGWLPLAAGVAMTGAVADQLPGRDVGLKWPNDVLVEGDKICGILAEVAGDAVIIGTGVNTAMTAPQLPVPTATSFAVLGVEVDVDRLLADYLIRLDGFVRALRGEEDAVASDLHAAAVACCVTLGQQVNVSLPDGSILSGRAQRLADDGRLVVDDGTEEHIISAGDVVHARLA